MQQPSKSRFSYSVYRTKQSLVQKWLADTTGVTAESSLRVLIILSQQPSETGSGVYLREVVRELQKLGHKPYLLAAHYRHLSNRDFPYLPDTQIYTMMFDNGENSKTADIRFPIPGMSLDMPYLHTTFRALSENMLDEYRKMWTTKIQTIVEEINPHIIHVNHLWLLLDIARLAAPWMPIVATSHGSEFKLLQDAPIFRPLVLPGIQGVDAVMPVSIDTAHQTVDIFGVHPKKVHIIGNGFNQQLFKILPGVSEEPILKDLLSRFHNLPLWKKLVLYVGKFADYKGVPYLIRAAKIYSGVNPQNVLTLIVGEGSKQARTKLEDLVEKLGLEQQVLLPGKVAYQEVCSLMNAADVFVLPSVDEPFGLVLLEALACGLRSVGSDRGGPPFFVPKVLRDKNLVTLIAPIKLFENQQPNPADEERYIAAIATAVSYHLSFQSGKQERQFIADTVKDQTWAVKTKELVKVYISAIRLRRDVVGKNQETVY